MPEELNNPSSGGLSMEAAADALMVQEEPLTEEDPAGATETEEVTESEATQNTQAREVDRPTVDEDEQAMEALSEDSEPETEDKAEEDDAPEEEEEQPEEDADEDSESDAEEEETDETKPEVFMTLEDGTEIDADEAKRGYLRQSDYTKKTQELAQGRQQLQQHAQQFAQDRQVLAENLNLAMSVIEPTLAEGAGIDWATMARDEPYEYAEKWPMFQQAQARYQELQKQGQQVVQQEQQRQQQMLKQRRAEETQKLKMVAPEFADPKTVKQFQERLRSYAKDVLKLSPQEFSNINDHRMWLLMDKAAKYDTLQKGALSAGKKKVKQAPTRPMTPGKPESTSEKQAQKLKQQRARLRQSGSLDDAAESLRLMGL